MKTKMNLLSYTFATVAGICFVSGAIILSGEKVSIHG